MKSPSLPGKPLLLRSCFSEVTLSLERPSRQTPLAGVSMLWLGRPGKLLLPGPCLLGPASSSCRGLVLNAWSSLDPKRSRGDPWRSPGKPCRMVLRLPVHKFGVVRYPYFSTPTGYHGYRRLRRWNSVFVALLVGFGIFENI